MTPEDKTNFIQDRANWSKARPQDLPRPTYWPFFFAVGLAFLVWGILAGWLISMGGMIVLIIALMGWITELRNERRAHEDGRR